MIDDVIGIAARVARLALRGDEGWQAEPAAQLDQYVLERADIAIGS